MKPSQDIKPITYMKTRSAELIERVTTQRCPIVITQSGEAKVVVQDVKSFERDRETLLFLKLMAEGITDAEQGRLVEQDALWRRLEKKLSKVE